MTADTAKTWSHQYKFQGTNWSDAERRTLIKMYQEGRSWESMELVLFRKAKTCRAELYKLRSAARSTLVLKEIDLTYSRRKKH